MKNEKEKKEKTPKEILDEFYPDLDRNSDDYKKPSGRYLEEWRKKCLESLKSNAGKRELYKLACYRRDLLDVFERIISGRK